jgi:hypothetical protein
MRSHAPDLPDVLSDVLPVGLFCRSDGGDPDVMATNLSVAPRATCWTAVTF